MGPKPRVRECGLGLCFLLFLCTLPSEIVFSTDQSDQKAGDMIDETDEAIETAVLETPAESPINRLPVGEGKRRRGRPRKEETKVAGTAAAAPKPPASVETPVVGASPDATAATSEAETRTDAGQGAVKAVDECPAMIEPEQIRSGATSKVEKKAKQLQARAAEAGQPDFNWIKRNR